MRPDLLLHVDLSNTVSANTANQASFHIVNRRLEDAGIESLLMAECHPPSSFRRHSYHLANPSCAYQTEALL